MKQNKITDNTLYRCEKAKFCKEHNNSCETRYAVKPKHVFNPYNIPFGEYQKKYPKYCWKDNSTIYIRAIPSPMFIIYQVRYYIIRVLGLWGMVMYGLRVFIAVLSCSDRLTTYDFVDFDDLRARDVVTNILSGITVLVMCSAAMISLVIIILMIVTKIKGG